MRINNYINWLIPMVLATGMAASAQDAGEKSNTPGDSKNSGIYVIRAKHILTGDGENLSDGVVVVQDGKILAFGRGVSEPSGAKILDADTVTPGLIESNASVGERNSSIEDAYEIAPSFHVMDSWDPSDPRLGHLLQNGVTSIFLAPGNLAVIGGLAGISKTAPANRPRLLSSTAALKCAFGDEPTFGNFTPRGFGLPNSYRVRRPGSRAGLILEMRLAFFEAERARRTGKKIDPSQKILIDSMSGSLPVRAHARSATDMRAALRVGKEFGLKFTFDEAFEAHRVLPELKAAQASVVIGPLPRDPAGAVDGTGRGIDLEDEDLCLDLLTRVADAGIPYALSAHDASTEDGLENQMRFAVRYGATKERALHAVTKGAAQILGIAGQTGSIKVGLDADLVLWGGDPFELTTRTVAVLVDGKVQFQRSAK